MALVVAGGVRVDEERPQQRHLEEQEGERRQREERENALAFENPIQVEEFLEKPASPGARYTDFPGNHDLSAI